MPVSRAARTVRNRSPPSAARIVAGSPPSTASESRSAAYDLCNSYGLDYTSNVMFLQRLNNRDNMATFYVGQSIYMPVYMAG